jgi:tetratricopeptide (TPR) repeat protein
MSSDSTGTFRDILKINLTISGLGLFSLLASLNPGWYLWGLDYIRIFPLWIRLSLIAALIFTAIPQISVALGKKLSDLTDVISIRSITVFYILFIVIMAALFIIFSSQNLLLGDGYNLLGNIKANMAISTLQPLDYMLHHFVYYILGGGEKAAYWSYVLCSYFAGILFFIGFFRFIENKNDLIPVVVIVLAFPMLQFFFGYVETYVISSTFAFFYLLSAYRDLLTQRISLVTIAWLILACLFHIYGIILLPSFMYIVWNKYHSRRILIISAIILIGMGVPGIYYLTSSANIQVFQSLVPLIPTSENPYHLFSWNHFWDILNLVLLCYPILLICPFMLKDTNAKQYGFYILALAPAMLFTILFDPTLGALRDWDLMSVASAPIMMILVTAVMSRRGNARTKNYSFIVPLAIFALLHTGSWILQNSNKDHSYPIIRDFVKNDIHYSPAYFKGARNKAWAKIVWGNFTDVDESIRSMKQRFAGEPDDTLNFGNLINKYLIKGDTAIAVQLTHDNWERFSGDLNSPLRDEIIYLLGNTMLDAKNYDEANKIFETYRKNGGLDHRIFMQMGLIYQKLGNMDSSESLYNQGFTLWPDASLSDQLNFYLRASKLKYYQISETGLKRIISQLPEKYVPSIQAIIDEQSAQRYDKANLLISTFWKDNMPKDAGRNNG